MQIPQKQNFFSDSNISQKDKFSSNFPPLINKEPIESKENFNMSNIPNYEMDNFKSPSKIYNHNNPSK